MSLPLTTQQFLRQYLDQGCALPEPVKAAVRETNRRRDYAKALTSKSALEAAVAARIEAKVPPTELLDPATVATIVGNRPELLAAIQLAINSAWSIVAVKVRAHETDLFAELANPFNRNVEVLHQFMPQFGDIPIDAHHQWLSTSDESSAAYRSVKAACATLAEIKMLAAHLYPPVAKSKYLWMAEPGDDADDMGSTDPWERARTGHQFRLITSGADYRDRQHEYNRRLQNEYAQAIAPQPAGIAPTPFRRKTQ